MNIKSIGIIGGDKRLIYTGRAFEKDNKRVIYTGFEKLDDVICKSTDEALAADIIVLPIPCSLNMQDIAFPFSDNTLKIDESLFEKIQGKPIFCGLKERLYNAFGNFSELFIFDYAKSESFALKNAVLTAKAALEILKERFPKGITKKNVLILGFGRVGKECVKLFEKEDCKLTVGARKDSDFIEIERLGHMSVNSTKLNSLSDYDIIVNTVNFKLLGQRELDKLNPNAYILDLASLPGGVDYEYAKNRGIHTNHALGLPGKYYPEKAGTIIKETIDEILKGGVYE